VTGGKWSLLEAYYRVTRAHRPDGPIPARQGNDEVKSAETVRHAASEIRERFIGRSLAFDPDHLQGLSRESA
jgi:hypothetical protein